MKSGRNADRRLFRSRSAIDIGQKGPLHSPFLGVSAVFIVLLLDIVQPGAQPMLGPTFLGVLLLLPPLLDPLFVLEIVQILVEVAQRRQLAPPQRGPLILLLFLLLLLVLLLLLLILLLLLLLLMMLQQMLALVLLLLLLALVADGTLLSLGGGPRDSCTTPTPAATGARQAARPRAPHLDTLAPLSVKTSRAGYTRLIHDSSLLLLHSSDDKQIPNPCIWATGYIAFPFVQKVSRGKVAAKNLRESRIFFPLVCFALFYCLTFFLERWWDECDSFRGLGEQNPTSCQATINRLSRIWPLKKFIKRSWF